MGNGDYGLVNCSRESRAIGSISPTIQFGNKVLAGPSNWPCLTKMHGVLGGSFAMNKQAFDAMDGGARNRAGTVFFEIGLANCHMVIKDIPIS